MINSNEVPQSEMDIDTLTLFNYITNGISSDIDLDYSVSSIIELNFD
jgi:hypothetical protein